MGDTFSGKWNRPDQSGNGHTMRELQDRASFDNQPQTGCGAMFLLCILAVAAILGVALT